MRKVRFFAMPRGSATVSGAVPRRRAPSRTSAPCGVVLMRARTIAGAGAGAGDAPGAVPGASEDGTAPDPGATAPGAAAPPPGVIAAATTGAGPPGGAGP